MYDDYIRVGDNIPNSYNKPYVLDVYNFIPILTPPKSVDMDILDPLNYFVTSGDAIQKTRQLGKDLYAYAGQARAILNSGKRTKVMTEFEKECWKAAGGCTTLMNALMKCRGEAIFLECEWNQHVLLCIPKNPRMRQ